MTPGQLAMAYQACAVADLATEAVGLDDPVEAVAQAARVLAAAEQLVAAANRLGSCELPADPLQRFAYEHPEEAAEDVADWVSRRP
ncbi:hypothetical protein [Kribbella speibonae]|uniref:Uncharacterized protein n=1 Tax=Kribbella speibonae TaxID=1572660 RepID=A0A4R0IP95_9ACTN|nr:hypothetical protein [Kribbella speibonae]TCC35531.1 hypothetical protein E0H92_22570 [Kribbella speibonae]